MITVCWKKDSQTLRGDWALYEQWLEQPEGFIWVDLNKLDKDDEKEKLLKLGCHELAIQDSQRERHPPKLEVFSDNTFLLYRGMSFIDAELNYQMISVSFFLFENCLVTVHPSDSLGVSAILDSPKLQGYLKDPVYLLCQILRASAVKIAEQLVGFEENLSDLEESISDNGTDDMLMQITTYRSHLRKLRRIFAYHEKVFDELIKEVSFNQPENSESQHVLQDVYEKMERLHSLANLYYDLCGDISDGYLSISSHKLNNTVQTLTIVSSIFIPLSFLAGLYGMNFRNIPELENENGYFILLAVMAIISIGLLLIFRKKKWL